MWVVLSKLCGSADISTPRKHAETLGLKRRARLTCYSCRHAGPGHGHRRCDES